MVSANNKGESGHPCLVLLDRANGSEIAPTILILTEGQEYKASIQLTKLGPNPALFSEIANPPYQKPFQHR